MQAGIAYIKKELAGIYPEPEIDALILIILQYIKSCSRTQILLARNEVLQDNERQQISAITARLKNHEPIQYITGETEFYGLKFYCRPGTLIPRPETEELVDCILKENAGFRGKILDIGTGTGCIPVTLKKRLPEAEISACDISESCLELASRNANLNLLDVSFFRMDILHPGDIVLPEFDILVSNPPYIPGFEKKLMKKNVLDYEPGLALFVPDHDPLLFYKSILKFAGKQLRCSGKIYWEINETFGQECVRLLSRAGYLNVRLRKDIQGKDRMISAQKP